MQDSSDTPVRTGITAIAAAGEHSLALQADGTVLAWGYGRWGQLGDGANTQRSRPVAVQDTGGTGVLSGVTALGAGWHQSYARTADGTTWAWGGNWHGQLGDGTTWNQARPVVVKDASGAGLAGVVGLAAGAAEWMLGRKSDGTAWAWGVNRFGQRGDGTHTQRLRPVRVDGGLGGGVTAGVPGALPNDPDPALRLDGVRSGLVGVKPVRVGADGAFSLEVWAKPASTADTGFVLSVDAGDQRARQVRFDGARGTFAGLAGAATDLVGLALLGGLYVSQRRSWTAR